MDSFGKLDPSSKLKNVSDAINNRMDEFHQEAGTTLLEGPDSCISVMDMHTEDEDHIRKMKEFQDYLEMVKRMVKPGCSQEVLKVALNSMSSLLSGPDFVLKYIQEAKICSEMVSFIQEHGTALAWYDYRACLLQRSIKHPHSKVEKVHSLLSTSAKALPSYPT